MRRHMQRNFRALRVDRAGLPALRPGRAALVYCNHPSWWDAALFIVLTEQCMAGRRGFGAMDQAALGKYRFMARIGVFGVERGSYRSTAAFLRTATAVLNEPDTVLWMTAEGSFADCRERPVSLQLGTAHLAARLDGIDLIPMAIEYCFWDEKLPEALCRFGPPVAAPDAPSVDAWRGALRDALTAQMDALAVSAMTRDPARFDVLLDGKVGVGGVYDLWRRARAAVRGERFSAGHGAPDR